jgi:hypothetical protein
MSKSKISLVSHPYALDLLRSRTDRAVVTGADLVERPYWFRNIETDQLYYDLYSCIGWPSEVTDSSDGLPGYAAIVGVVRPNKDFGSNPLDANFQLLAEAESKDVPTLLKHCQTLRAEWGFGVQKELLRVWLGDPERFLTTLALANERLIEEGGEAAAILVSPSDDLYTPKIFDNYVRALRSTLLKETRRFYFGHNDILQNRLREFRALDPCVMAMGGLVHTLLCRCTWMDARQESVFNIEDENEFK